jgi:hypothetical protein
VVSHPLGDSVKIAEQHRAWIPARQERMEEFIEEPQKELATRLISLEEVGASQLDVCLEIKLKQAFAGAC